MKQKFVPKVRLWLCLALAFICQPIVRGPIDRPSPEITINGIPFLLAANNQVAWFETIKLASNLASDRGHIEIQLELYSPYGIYSVDRLVEVDNGYSKIALKVKGKQATPLTLNFLMGDTFIITSLTPCITPAIVDKSSSDLRLLCVGVKLIGIDLNALDTWLDR